jgi:DNA repair protein RecO (recombination protein O)
MQSYIINGVRKNNGSIRPSQLLPLNLLELEVYHQQNKNLQRIKELKCTPPLKQLHFDMVKSAIGMFMSEVIYRSIKEENQIDESLFDYLYHTIQIVDMEQGRLVNFPINFLLQLSRFLGFYPKHHVNENATLGFNFKDGLFEPYDEKNPFQADINSSSLLLRLLHLDAVQQQEMFIEAPHRKLLLNLLVLYYNEHVTGFSNMRSHEILSEVLE